MVGTDSNTWLHGYHPRLLYYSLKHALVSKLKRYKSNNKIRKLAFEPISWSSVNLKYIYKARKSMIKYTESPWFSTIWHVILIISLSKIMFYAHVHWLSQLSELKLNYSYLSRMSRSEWINCSFYTSMKTVLRPVTF